MAEITQHFIDTLRKQYTGEIERLGKFKEDLKKDIVCETDYKQKCKDLEDELEKMRLLVSEIQEKEEHYKNEIEKLQAEKNEITETGIMGKEEFVSVELTARKCVALCKEFKVNSKRNTQVEIDALLACLTNGSPTSFYKYWSDTSKAQDRAERYAKEMKNRYLDSKK